MHVVGVSVYTPTLYRTGWVSLTPACALMQHIAMWCTGVCCLEVATTMLLECTSNKYTHSPASDQKGKTSSSQPPASQSRQVSLMPAWGMWCMVITGHGAQHAPTQPVTPGMGLATPPPNGVALETGPGPLAVCAHAVVLLVSVTHE